MSLLMVRTCVCVCVYLKGKTYLNDCFMKVESCHLDRPISVYHQSECQPSEKKLLLCYCVQNCKSILIVFTLT